MRYTPLCLLTLAFASSCADPPLEPAFDIAFDGASITGRFVEGNAAVRFHAEAIAGRDAAAVSLDLGDRRLDVILDRTDALLTEDAHGATFTARDRELMLGLRDHLFAADAALLESMPGLLLAKVADRYAEVPLDLPRLRLDTRLDAPQQDGKADIAPGACGDDGVTCLDGTWGSSWAAFAINDTCEAYLAPYGDSSCRGRCGLGCSWFDEDYTWDCHDHDICLDKGGNCSDEFADAADDWAATTGPYCWGGSNRPKPSSPPPPPPPPPPPVCGNAVIEAGEECDDGNTSGGDGCSGTCQGSCAGISCDGPTGGTCHCDAKCADVGDCCADKFAVCGAGDGWVAAAAGYDHSCGLREKGRIACWGRNDYGQASPPAGTFAAVAAGYWHGCAIDSGGHLACWGRNDYGQASPPPGSFVRVSAGEWHSCGLDAAGSIICWGRNNFGQINPPAGSFAEMTIGGRHHGCGIAPGGDLTCWGRNQKQQASPPPGQFIAASGGEWHTCAIRVDSSLACWGNDEWDQLSLPTGSFTDVSAGERHSCAIRSSGALACWGRDDLGQATPPAGKFSQVSAGGLHSCAVVDDDGEILCWGRNNHGQIPGSLTVDAVLEEVVLGSDENDAETEAVIAHLPESRGDRL